jgi:putative transposase
MARLARVVAVGVPHHITQRGNGRPFILASDAERTVYMELLQQAVQLHSLTVLAYCLMSNHIHLVAIPQKPDSLAQYSERNSRDVTPHVSLLAS